MNRRYLYIERASPGFVVSQREVQYVQGKPYRFEIVIDRSFWRFDCENGNFEIYSRVSQAQIHSNFPVMLGLEGCRLIITSERRRMSGEWQKFP